MPLSTLDPALLSTFLVVVETSRISGAAKRLHLSQPAVTAQIKKLEEAFGVALFVRSVRGVVPTAAGACLADHARAVQRQIDAAIFEIGAAGRGNLGPLVLAASTTIAAHPLPPLLAEFRKRHRDVPVRVRIGNTEEVIEDVLAGHAPFGLVEGYARAPGIRLEPFIDDEIVPIVGRGAPFRLRQTRDLDEVPILWREAGSGTRAVVARALKKAGLDRRRAMKLDIDLASTEALIGAAAAGLGVAFVSRWSVRAPLEAGLVQLVPGLELVIHRTFRWALPAGSLSGAAAQFYAIATRARPRL
ncbi:MAG: LysR family transcriptional regulator [Polyangiaceae bacterium]